MVFAGAYVVGGGGGKDEFLILSHTLSQVI